MKVLVRRAKESDFAHLYMLFQELDSYHVRMHPEIFQPFKGDPRPRKLLKSIIYDDAKILLVAELNSEVIGFANGYITSAPNLPMFKPKTIGYIENICVTKAKRRLGAGRSLYDQLFNWFKGKEISEIELTVYQNITPAIEFYKKMGFECIKLTMSLNANRNNT